LKYSIYFPWEIEAKSVGISVVKTHRIFQEYGCKFDIWDMGNAIWHAEI
jgi:hypothetical protein